MNSDQQDKLLRLIFQKHNLRSIKEKLTNKGQTVFLKEAKKIVLSKLTIQEKKKIYVSYKSEKESIKLSRQMNKNEQNAKNRVEEFYNKNKYYPR